MSHAKVIQRDSRFGLRSLFYWMFCAAAGLTVAVVPNRIFWPQAALATATLFIAIGLLRQAGDIRRYFNQAVADQSLRWAARFESFWRISLAVGLTILLVAKFLINRKALTLEDRLQADEILSRGLHEFIWWFLLCICLSHAVPRDRAATSANRSIRWRTWLVGLLASFVAFFVIVDQTFANFLVHWAVQRIDQRLMFTGDRYALLMPYEQIVLMIAGGIAVLAVLAASLLMVKAITLHSQERRRRITLVFRAGLLLSAAAAYDAWFYHYAFPALSPYMAEGPIGSNWLQRSAGVILALILCCIGAVWMNKKAAPASGAELQMQLKRPAEDVLAAALLLVSSGHYFYSLARYFFGLMPGMLKQWYIWLGIFLNPSSLLVLAVAITAVKVLQACWKGRESVVLRLKPVYIGRFVLSVVALALIFLVTAPTLAVFSFSVWLAGPLSPWMIVH